MIGLITISLSDLRYFGYHGLYEEEKKAGNEFLVDVSVSYQPVAGLVDHLEETINYVTLHEMVSEEMKSPRELLETLAMEMAENIHTRFRKLKKITVSIKKLQPPMFQFTGNACVSYTREF